MSKIAFLKDGCYQFIRDLNVLKEAMVNSLGLLYS